MKYNNLNSSKKDFVEYFKSNINTILTIAGIVVLITASLILLFGKIHQNDVSAKLAAFNEKISDQLIVTTYEMENDKYSDDYMVLARIENNSKYDLDVELILKVKGFAFSEEEHDANFLMQSGTSDTLILTFYSMFNFNPNNCSHEYEVSAKEISYEETTSALSYETSFVDDKVIISVTNNGDYPIERIVGKVLFFKEDTWVELVYLFFNDEGVEPGETITQEISCDVPYDSYEIYLTGIKF